MPEQYLVHTEVQKLFLKQLNNKFTNRMAEQRKSGLEIKVQFSLLAMCVPELCVYGGAN